ncbi:hypothetical protein, partial [Enterococcus faecium]
GETLHDISQKEGVRLESILAFNRINKDVRPLTGEKIYLRYNAPVSPKTMSKENINLGGN